jgi:hypothetical protein
MKLLCADYCPKNLYKFALFQFKNLSCPVCRRIQCSAYMCRFQFDTCILLINHYFFYCLILILIYQDKLIIYCFMPISFHYFSDNICLAYLNLYRSNNFGSFLVIILKMQFIAFFLNYSFNFFY